LLFIWSSLAAFSAKKKPAVGGFFDVVHASTHRSLPNNVDYDVNGVAGVCHCEEG
jgi:hypothetical protein